MLKISIFVYNNQLDYEMSDKNSQLLAALIADRKLNTGTIGRVMRLYSSGKDVITYLQKDYSDAQLQEILTGLEEGCDVSFYDNTKLSPEQMKAIRLGVSQLSDSQVQTPIEIESTPSETETAEERKTIPQTDVAEKIEGRQTGEKVETNNDDESNSPSAKILGGLFGFITIAAIILLPRLCSQRVEKKNIELIQDLNNRGLVVKDGDVKYEPQLPKMLIVKSGDLFLEHPYDWESTTGDADGYGYHIELSHNSSFIAAIQVVAFRNPKHMPLNSAVDLSKKQISAMFDGIKATTEEVRDYDLNDTPAKVFDYKLAGDSNLNRRCITAVKGDYILLINEAFENYDNKDFNGIFGSIEQSIKIISKISDSNQHTPSTQVSSPRPSSKNMTISREEATVGVGKTITLKAYNYGSKLRWESDDTDIATVSQGGVVRGKSPGSVLVWAIGDEETYLCCDVTVE